MQISLNSFGFILLRIFNSSYLWRREFLCWYSI